MSQSTINATVSSLIPPGTPSPLRVSSPQQLRQANSISSPMMNSLAQDLDNIQRSVNAIHTQAQAPPSISQLLVTNQGGQPVAALGTFLYRGVPQTNWFSEAHIGTPVASTQPNDPTMAVFNANTDGSIAIGNTGWVDVHDEFDGNAAWIGTQNDTLPISNAVNNGAGLIRLTVTAHTLATGNQATVKYMNLVNVKNANGNWTVTVIDANTIDLQGSVWSGPFQPITNPPPGLPTYQPTIDRVLQITGVTGDGGLIKIQTAVPHQYESGTKVNIPAPGPGGVPAAVGQWIIAVPALLAVTGAANNGAGLIRLTITGGNFETGDKVQVLNVGGVPNADGNWTVTAISATVIDLQTSTFLGTYTSGGTATFTNPNVFDLVGSTFSGAYTSGGTVLQYFAGMLAESIAIGPSFQDYKLRAFPSGDLRIRNAQIELSSAAGQITLNPTTAQIVLTSATSLASITLDATVPALTFFDQTGAQDVSLEILSETALAVSSATNASPVVMSVPGCTTANPSGFPYVDGDTVFVSGATGNTAINGYRIVENLGTAGPDTFTMTDLRGTTINGNGALAGTVTCQRYFAGLLAQSLAIGGNWNAYRLRFFADGTLKINNATISNSTITGATVAGDFTTTAGTNPNVLTLTTTGAVLTISGTGTEAGHGTITIDGAMTAANYNTPGNTGFTGTLAAAIGAAKSVVGGIIVN